MANTLKSVLVRILLFPAILPAILPVILPVPVFADSTASPAADWYQWPDPDQSDWSGKRRSGYARAAQLDLGVPQAVLEIPSLQLTVPVYDNAERPALERGAGWVQGTARPGAAGNVAIAGHRDGFFRSLEKISAGAQVVLVTPEKSLHYLIEEISIVDPLDISVLAPTPEHMLTLITCYPFRYAGYAPDRFIVRARLLDE